MYPNGENFAYNVGLKAQQRLALAGRKPRIFGLTNEHLIVADELS